MIHGIDVFTGQAVEIRSTNTIQAVDSLTPAPQRLPFVAPGFVDLQVNGFAGVDYCAPDAPLEHISKSLKAQFATGVTRLFATVITGTEANLTGALRNLRSAKESLPEGAAIEGIHVEGPHISPEDGARGAHPRHCVRPPDIDEYERWQEAAGGHVKLVTVSPEWPGAAKYIEHLVRDGVVVSIGHTSATAGHIADAVAAGATMSTHLGNGAHAVLPRHPNYIWEQMADDRLIASFIVDGIHLDAAFVKVGLRAKGIERAVLVTDAVMPAGCEPGPYKLGEVDVELHADGSVRLRGGTRLAGSALTMDRAVSNVVRLTGVSLRDATTMATVNPARVAKIAGRQGGLRPGERADFVLFEFVGGEVRILETYLSGERVY